MGFVDKKRALQALVRRLWLIILAALLAAGSSFCISKWCIKPRYEAETKLYVNNSGLSLGSTELSISSSQLTAAQSLVDTYIVILNSRLTLNEVIRLAELECSYEELLEQISAKSVEGTEIFQVVVTDTDPARAAKIANTIAVILPEKIAGVVEGSSVRVVDYAQEPRKQSAPSPIKDAALALLVGTVASATLILFHELFNRKIRTAEYLTRHYARIPLLAVVPESGKG